MNRGRFVTGLIAALVIMIPLGSAVAEYQAPADFDGDGDVDSSDFLTFAVCYNGPENLPLPSCVNWSADFDWDYDVDGADFLTFTNCYNGSLNPARAQCGNPVPLTDIGSTTLTIESSGRETVTLFQGLVPSSIPIEIYASATASGPGGANNGVHALYLDVAGTAVVGVLQPSLGLDTTFTQDYEPLLSKYGLGFDVYMEGGAGLFGRIAGIGAAQVYDPWAGIRSDDMPGALTPAAPHSNGRPPVLVASGTVNLPALTAGYHTITVAGKANLWEVGGFTSPSVVTGDELTIRVLRRGDIDGDNDSDGHDFLTFSICYNGSMRLPRPACPTLAPDLDGDFDVDGIDFLTFSVCYNGPMRPPQCW